MVHSLANGPEVKKPLLETSRAGYLAAVGVSAYTNVSLVRNFAPMMRPGGSFLSLTYMAGERVVPGYGGGMSSAKAALESDTRTLAFEAGRRWGVRVNTITAGPLASRAATAIGFIDTMIDYTEANSPLPRRLDAADVGATAAFLASPLAAAITGSVVYVDNGYHAMGMAVSAAGIEPPAARDRRHAGRAGRHHGRAWRSRPGRSARTRCGRVSHPATSRRSRPARATRCTTGSRCSRRAGWPIAGPARSRAPRAGASSRASCSSREVSTR